MSTKRFKAMIAVLFLSLVFLLGSCNIIENILGLGNESPTVTLIGSTSFTEGTVQTYSATASDPDGDSLTYTWYLDDVLQTNAYLASITWDGVGYGGTSATLSVEVSDGESSASAYLTITVEAGNAAPVVTLSVDNYYPYSDETVTLTADATDDDGDSLTYDWYVDDVLQTVDDSTNPEVTFTHLADYSETVTIKVLVSDGTDTGEASVDLYYYPAASFHIDNSSGYSIYYVYRRPYLSTGIDWTDMLGSNIIPTGYSWKILGITAATYDIEIVLNDSYGTAGLWQDRYFWDGYYQYADIYTASISNWSMSQSPSFYSMIPLPQGTVKEASAGLPAKVQVTALGAEPRNAIFDHDYADKLMK